MTFGCKAMGTEKSEFVAKTQFSFSTKCNQIDKLRGK